jgi:ComF family protein
LSSDTPGWPRAGVALQWTSRLLLDPVLAALFPSRCAACAVSLARPTRGPLCDACWGALPRHQGPQCRCGFPLPGGLDAPCGRCRRSLSALARGYSLGPYEGSLRVLLHELKYRGRRRVAERLAELICADTAARPILSTRAVLVPVPLHPRRHTERGFNQSELLASALARRAGFSLHARALVRRKDTPPQTGLSAAERRRNVAGAFAVRERPSVHGKAIVLVDDVLTTGATARACAAALRAAGAAAVDLVTVARVA